MKTGVNGKKQLEELKDGEMSGSEFVSPKETDSANNDLSKITSRTEEERYTAMLLDVMRGANKQDRAAILGTIDSFHPHRNEARPAMDMPSFRKHASPEEEKGQEGQTPPEREPEKEKMVIEFDYDGQTEQVPADFFYIVDEARERLDKIRVILGYLRETT